MNRHLKTLLFCFFVIGINAGNSYAVFRLNVESLEGEDAIDFGRLKAMEDGGTPIPVTESKRVRLNVTTDLNQPYIVSQMVDREPVNTRGVPTPLSAFRVFATLNRGSGTNRMPNRIPLSTGETQIYLSDSAGEEAEMILQYDIEVPPFQRAGNYRTSITYRIVTV